MRRHARPPSHPALHARSATVRASAGRPDEVINHSYDSITANHWLALLFVNQTRSNREWLSATERSQMQARGSASQHIVTLV